MILGLPGHFDMVKFAFYAFILQEIMEIVDEFCAKVNNAIK